MLFSCIIFNKMLTIYSFDTTNFIFCYFHLLLMLSLGRGQEDTGMLASGLTCSAPTPQNGQRIV